MTYHAELIQGELINIRIGKSASQFFCEHPVCPCDLFALYLYITRLIFEHNCEITRKTAKERDPSGLTPHANLDGKTTVGDGRRERRTSDYQSNEDKSKVTARDPVVGETETRTRGERKREIRMNFSSVQFRSRVATTRARLTYN